MTRSHRRGRSSPRASAPGVPLLVLIASLSACGDSPLDAPLAQPVSLVAAEEGTSDVRSRLLPALDRGVAESVARGLDRIQLAAAAGDTAGAAARLREVREVVERRIAARPPEAPDLGAVLLLLDLYSHTIASN